MATPTTLPATFVAGNVLTAQQMNDLRGAFRILQVVTTTKDDTFSASVASGANTAVTGLSVSITPTATSSQVLVVASVPVSISGADNHGVYFTLFRGATAIGVGASPSSRQAVTSGTSAILNNFTMNMGNITYLDSPATTSATTYSINVSHTASTTRTIYVNRTVSDTDNDDYGRTIATITAFEVSA
jgi:hypothetical protein